MFSVVRLFGGALFTLAIAVPGSSQPDASSSPPLTDESLVAADWSRLSSPAARQGSIAGTVVESGTQRPLAGAQVYIPGTDLGVLTDGDGAYTLTEVPVGEQTVRVELIGYGALERQVVVREGEATRVDFEIERQALALDEIVVTGTAGGQRTRAIGNVVGRVNAAEQQQIAPSSQVQEMLSAQVPGVRIMRTGGEVGTGGISRIRGASSISLTGQPLVYVDGVRVDGGDQTPGMGIGAFRGGEQPSRINDLPPEDIESIEVIKGPAAATLYGTEASNGVINIITKKGSEGAPTVNLRLRQGAYWLPDPVNFFPPTYYRCSGASQEVDVDPRLRCEPGEIVEVNILQIERDIHGYEWFRTGQAPAVSGDVSGGTETLRYHFSADWDREEGYVPYNWRSRLGGRANLGYTPTEQLSFDFNIGAVRSTSQSASTQQPLTTAILWACPAPGCEPGSGSGSALDGPMRGYIGYLPEIYEDEIEGFQNVDRTTAGLTINHIPTSWLTQRLTLGGDFTNIRDTQLWRATGSLGNTNPDGQKEIGHTRGLHMTLDYGADATWDASPELTLTTSAGAQFYRRVHDASFARGTTFPIDALETVSSGAVRTAGEESWENRSFGVYVQEQIGWRDRVFLTAALRGDDNSAFGENFTFVTYPKFSASWVLSEEPFLAGQRLLNTFRLRAAWGRAGQQPNVFDAVRTYQPVDGVEGQAAITPNNVGNPDLKPEVGDELELGFDASFLDGRVSAELTHFRQRTVDALVRVPTVPSLGFPGFQFRNIGETQNRGIELGLNAQVYRGEDASLDLGFTLASSKNKVVDLGGENAVVQNVSDGQYHVEGFPIAGIFAKRVVSADLVEQESGRNTTENRMCEGGELVPGTNFSRGGGAPVPCDDAPQVYWGQPLPEWEGSVSANLTLFRNLTIYGLVDFIRGRTWINGDIRSAHHSFLNTRAMVEGTDPIIVSYVDMGGDGRPQPGLMSGDFAKLRTVSAQYRLPDAWAQRLGASRLTFTAAADNLAILWMGAKENFGHRSIDPERASQTGGETDGLSATHQEGWPVGRRVTTTLRVTF